jgi:hypothetical protein
VEDYSMLNKISLSRNLKNSRRCRSIFFPPQLTLLRIIYNEIIIHPLNNYLTLPVIDRFSNGY